MIGFRGASRYYDDRYREGFRPGVCRNQAHARGIGPDQRQGHDPVLPDAGRGPARAGRNGRERLAARGGMALEVYVMCEIPNNVVLADEFADLFDGFSIGSNDLTQLTLGVDRDSELLAHIFDERDPGVKRDDRNGRARRAAQGPQDRHLRPGAQRLPGVRPVAGRDRHRFDLAQSRLARDGRAKALAGAAPRRSPRPRMHPPDESNWTGSPFRRRISIQSADTAALRRSGMHLAASRSFRAWQPQPA